MNVYKMGTGEDLSGELWYARNRLLRILQVITSITMIPQQTYLL